MKKNLLASLCIPLAGVLFSMTASAQLLDIKRIDPALVKVGDSVQRLVASTVPDGLKTGDKIPNRYIVVLKPVAGQSVDQVVAQLSQTLGMKIHFIYRNALNGFSATLPAAAVPLLSALPVVDYIEQEHVVGTEQAAQTNVEPWGLDRIDSRKGYDSTYLYDTDARLVTAYVIDSGILPNHVEFGGRVSGGYSVFNDGRGTVDCYGHGTHVAGTIGGATYGVAKRVNLVPVKVLNCNGIGNSGSFIAALDWIISNGRPNSVVNMSLATATQSTVDAAVDRVVAAGHVVVASAGNKNTNACSQSPARAAKAITVGATNIKDSRASFSNFGSCVDLFAPGEGVLSAWSTSSTATRVVSGTSMAAPHVTGAAALVRSKFPSLTPEQVTNALVATSTANILPNPGNGSPNLLLYSLLDQNPAQRPEVAPGTMYVSGLIGGVTTIITGGWRATVTITVSDMSTRTPLANARVTGTFSTGRVSTCTTNSSGICTVNTQDLSNKVTPVTYDLTAVVVPSGRYTPEKNVANRVVINRY